MNEQLMQITVHMIDFLSNSEEAIVDPDSAVEQLEDIAALLDQLDGRERSRFVEFTSELADATDDDDPELAEFYRSIPEEMGLN